MTVDIDYCDLLYVYFNTKYTSTNFRYLLSTFEITIFLYK